MKSSNGSVPRRSNLSTLRPVTICAIQWLVTAKRYRNSPSSGARADAGLSTRHHAGYGARSNMRGSVDANALVANPDAYVRDTDGSDPEGM